MLEKRSLLATVLFALTAAAPAVAADTPGVTATEIKIGNTDPYSGPASAFSVVAKLETAFFKMVNDRGGVAGRKINFISLDDGYSPPKTLEQVRRLIEEDQVALLFNNVGTACNSAIQKYVNQKQVPHLFISSGADKWGDYQHFPWTIGFQPSFRTEAQIYAKYILKEKPNPKIAILPLPRLQRTFLVFLQGRADGRGCNAHHIFCKHSGNRQRSLLCNFECLGC
jgi:branched-chain amino acid transport system substrate-binding protein